MMGGEAAKKNSKNTGLFEKHSFRDFTEAKFKDFLSEGRHQILNQIEGQLEVFKVQAQKDLEFELKRNVITPRTHRRKGEELEVWASTKRHELKRQIEPINIQVQSIMDSLKKEKISIFERIGISPSPGPRYGVRDDSSLMDYDEINEDHSDESDRTRKARLEIGKLSKNDFEDFEASESTKFDKKI